MVVDVSDTLDGIIQAWVGELLHIFNTSIVNGFILVILHRKRKKKTCDKLDGNTKLVFPQGKLSDSSI